MELQREKNKALTQVKHKKGLLSICSSCKKLRDDSGYWQQVEQYIEKITDLKFSHGMCPECLDEFYGDQDWYIKMKKKHVAFTFCFKIPWLLRDFETDFVKLFFNDS